MGATATVNPSQSRREMRNALHRTYAMCKDDMGMRFASLGLSNHRAWHPTCARATRWR